MNLNKEQVLVEQIQAVCDTLIQKYGEAISESKQPALDTLIRAILSQNTTDVNMDRAFKSLKEKYSTWEAVLAAPEEELGAAIHSSGFYRLKAQRIQSSLAEINRRVGKLDLSLLEDMNLDESMDWLTSLHGVGPKTAAILLLFHYGKPALPVDTHVWRVSKRLGILPENVNRVKAQTLLQEFIPQECLYSFNHNLVKHGREICRARKPQCVICFLQDNCAYYHSRT
ncbi:MAG: endonuclease III domain-containing protein [Promethearchaeota archaeon]